jgi:hypothetical protein
VLPLTSHAGGEIQQRITCGTRSTPHHDDRECEHHLPKAQVRPGAGGSTASTIGSKRDGPCRCASLAPGMQYLVQYVEVHMYCIYSTVLHHRHPGHVGSSILFYRDLRRRQRPVMSASCPRCRTRGTIQYRGSSLVERAGFVPGS